jgi:hypothetical protein
VTGTEDPARAAHGYIALPDGWERVSADGPGPFVTHEVVRRPDGTLAHWRSRAHRKSTPHGTRWMAALFAVGASCFLLASLTAQSRRRSPSRRYAAAGGARAGGRSRGGSWP